MDKLQIRFHELFAYNNGTIINGSSPSITFSDGSAQTSATRPFLNRIINGVMTDAKAYVASLP